MFFDAFCAHTPPIHFLGADNIYAGRISMPKIGGILLCAGYGSRLAPLTDVIPKPAIPFCGVPMAHYARHFLEKAGISELGMNVHHLPERMVKAMDGGKWLDGTRQIIVSRENDEILGTGGGAARTARLMPSCDTYIVYHGDVLCEVDLNKALASHLESGADVTLVVLPRPAEIKENVRKSLGMIGVIDEEIVCIRDWHKNGVHVESFLPRCFSGIHIVERRVLESIPDGMNVCLVTQIYRKMLECGARIHAWEPENEVFFADVGTPASYLEAQARYLWSIQTKSNGPARRAAGKCLFKPTDDDAAPSYLFGRADIPKSLQILGNVCIHEGTVLPVNGQIKDVMMCREGGIQRKCAWIV